MPSDTDTLTITIRKRPWWFWVLAGLWVLLEVLFLQTALASAREGEYRAAAISWIAVGVLAAAGVLVGSSRADRTPRPGERPILRTIVTIVPSMEISTMRQLSILALLFICLCTLVQAQAPIGTLEGQITDPASALVSTPKSASTTRRPASRGPFYPRARERSISPTCPSARICSR